MWTKKTPGFLKKIPKPVLFLFACLLVIAIGELDYAGSYHISVSFLYLFPVILVAWLEGCVSAVVISILSALSWAATDLASGHIYSHLGLAVWYAFAMLALLLIVACFTVLIRKIVITDRRKANRDSSK